VKIKKVGIEEIVVKDEEEIISALFSVSDYNNFRFCKEQL
jgi:hypothetical protein